LFRFGFLFDPPLVEPVCPRESEHYIKCYDNPLTIKNGGSEPKWLLEQSTDESPFVLSADEEDSEQAEDANEDLADGVDSLKSFRTHGFLLEGLTI